MSNSLLKSSVTPQQKKIISETCRNILAKLENRSWLSLANVNQPLCANFGKHGLSDSGVFKTCYPFNQDSKGFFTEFFDLTLYKNPRRLAFVKRWAKKNLDE
jgi:hypothetical protein